MKLSHNFAYEHGVALQTDQRIHILLIPDWGGV